MKNRLQALAEVLGGTLHGADAGFDGASIDTRTLARGALFFALPGSRVDGHDFVARAASLGASAAVVTRVLDSRLAQIEVANVQAALQSAGRLARAHFEGAVVGVTGSNGKTTTKQMLAAILAEAGSVLATHGNLNNHLGVPLTLLRLDDQAERAVIEMGANHPGEIAQLAAMARPTVGVVTNAGWAHLEGFGSREGIAAAKGELFAHLPDDGVAVINADDDFADVWRDLAGARRRLCFAIDAPDDVDVRATDIALAADGSRFTLAAPAGQVHISLALAGRHNIANALAAATAAIAVGIDLDAIARGLAGMVAVSGRLAVTQARHGARLVDDSYNANPGSLAAALTWLGQQPGERWAALGDMGELGDYSDTAHRDAGLAARAAGLERLFVTGTYGPLTVEAFGEGAHWFADHASLNAALDAALAAAGGDVVVLVKGSRSARMELVADALRIEASARTSAHAAHAAASC